MWTLVARHLTNREIADELVLSVRTVEHHVASLIRKLLVTDRRALARHHDAPGVGTHRGQQRWPAPLSSFIGRETEYADLMRALSAHRMVTVTGPGGVGKTRLSLRVVEDFATTRRDGGWAVDLVHVTDPGLVMAAVATVVGVAAPLGGSLEQAVAASLGDSDAVLLLDNCEHVVDAVRECAAYLLGQCLELVVVATSRIRLQAPFEWVFPVPGLSVDDASGDAVALFSARARGAGAAEPLDGRRVAGICRSLDGMALAIELAAARCPTLGLDGLADGLEQGLRLLTSGSGTDDRHRSLRDAIAWSYRLLPSQDRDLLSAVSVLASWFDLDTALYVARPREERAGVADGLARLADHHLLVVSPGAPTRYRALETIRQFGAERIAEDGRANDVHERHRMWCREQLADLAEQPRDVAWCERLDRVAAEARLAVTWAVAHPPGPPVAAELAQALAEQLLLRGRPGESQRAYVQAAKLSPDPAARARLLVLAAGAAASRLVGNDALRLFEEAASEAVSAGDSTAAAEDLAWMAVFYNWAPGIIAELPGPQERDAWLARARSLKAASPAAEATILLATAHGMPDTEVRTADTARRARALARQANRPLVESAALDSMCAFHMANGRLEAALGEISRRGDVMRDVPLDAETAYHFNDYLLMASEVHLAAGRLDSAAEYADRLGELDCYRDYPHPALARRLKVDVIAGDLDSAVARGERFLAAWERAGRPVSGTLNVSAYAMALVHGLLGDEPSRRRWVEVARTLTIDPARLDSCITGWAPAFDGLLALDRGDPEGALTRMCADIDEPKTWGNQTSAMWRPWYAALWAEAGVLAEHPETEERIRRARPQTRENPIAATIVARAADLARGDRVAVAASAATFATLGCDYQRGRSEALADASQ